MTEKRTLSPVPPVTRQPRPRNALFTDYCELPFVSGCPALMPIARNTQMVTRPAMPGYPSTWTTSVDACRASDAHNCAMVQSQWEPGTSSSSDAFPLDHAAAAAAMISHSIFGSRAKARSVTPRGSVAFSKAATPVGAREPLEHPGLVLQQEPFLQQVVHVGGGGGSLDYGNVLALCGQHTTAATTSGFCGAALQEDTSRSFPSRVFAQTLPQSGMSGCANGVIVSSAPAPGSGGFQFEPVPLPPPEQDHADLEAHTDLVAQPVGVGPRDDRAERGRAWKRERVLLQARARKHEAQVKEEEAALVDANTHVSAWRAEVVQLQETEQELESNARAASTEHCQNTSRLSLTHVEHKTRQEVLLAELHEELSSRSLALEHEAELRHGQSHSDGCPEVLEEQWAMFVSAEEVTAREVAQLRRDLKKASRERTGLQMERERILDEIAAECRFDNSECTELEDLVARCRVEESRSEAEEVSLHESNLRLITTIGHLERRLSESKCLLRELDDNRERHLRDRKRKLSEVYATTIRSRRDFVDSKAQKHQSERAELEERCASLKEEHDKDRLTMNSLSAQAMTQLEDLEQQLQQSQLANANATEKRNALRSQLQASRQEVMHWETLAEERQVHIQKMEASGAEQLESRSQRLRTSAQSESATMELRTSLTEATLNALREELTQQRAADQLHEEQVESELSAVNRQLRDWGLKRQQEKAEISAAIRKVKAECAQTRMVLLDRSEEALGSLRSDLVSEYSEEMEREAAYLGRELQQREHVVSQEVSERVRDSVAKEHLEELSAHRSRMLAELRQAHAEYREVSAHRLRSSESAIARHLSKSVKAHRGHEADLRAAEAKAEQAHKIHVKEAEARLETEYRAKVEAVETTREAVEASCESLRKSITRRSALFNDGRKAQVERVKRAQSTDAESQKEFWHSWMSERGFWLDMVTQNVESKVTNKIPNQPALVCDNLYVSGVDVLNNHDFLRRNHVTLVFSCQGRGEGRPDLEAALPKHVRRKRLPIPDAPWYPILKMHFAEVCHEVGRLAPGERAVVHCTKGLNRSCALAVALLMWRTTNCRTPVQLLEQCWFQVASARGEAILMNWGFRMQLFIFATALLDGKRESYAYAWPPNWGPELWLRGDSSHVPRPDRAKRRSA